MPKKKKHKQPKDTLTLKDLESLYNSMHRGFANTDSVSEKLEPVSHSETPKQVAVELGLATIEDIYTELGKRTMLPKLVLYSEGHGIFFSSCFDSADCLTLAAALTRIALNETEN